MEESGRKFLRPRNGRLLTRFFGTFFLCLCTGLPLAALEVDLFVSSFEVAPGESVVISFTVNGSEPATTSLAEPAVPESFLPSSSRKELAQLESTGIFSGSRTRATVITREWIPSESGSFSLGPFTVTSGTESVTLPPVYITVVSPLKAEISALRWSVADGGAKNGKPLSIALEALLEGKPGPVTCAAPENAILTAVPATGRIPGDAPVSDAGWITVAEYEWTPLAEGSLALPVAMLEYTTPAGDVRKIASRNQTVTVSGAAAVSGQAPVSGALGKAFTRPAAATAAITENTGPVPFSLEGLPAEIARSLSGMPWQAGNYARILHVLRTAEYTGLFPSRYRAIRRAAEESLSLGETLDVPPAAWKLWCVTGCAALLSLSLLLRLAGGRSAFLRGLSFMGFSASLLLAIFAVFVYTRDMLPAGVVTGGNLMTVPEPSSTVIETLSEGRTVRIRRTAGDWHFVSTDSSLEGWLPASGVLQYTIMEQHK